MPPSLPHCYLKKKKIEGFNCDDQEICYQKVQKRNSKTVPSTASIMSVAVVEEDEPKPRKNKQMVLSYFVSVKSTIIKFKTECLTFQLQWLNNKSQNSKWEHQN
jgi:hypothetical protein